MSRRSRLSSQGDPDIAQLAARLLVEGSVRSFGAAKRKAAALCGARGGARNLPSNLHVLYSVVEYQRIFEFTTLAERNEKLRRAALVALQELRDFSPRLHGAVLFGTTLRTSAVEIHLFCDETEQVTRFLLERGMVFQLTDVQLTVAHERTARFACFHTSLRDTDFELTVLPVHALRQRLCSPFDGLPYRYLDHAELSALLAVNPGGIHQLDLSGAFIAPQ
jgi:hypothetical protein